MDLLLLHGYNVTSTKTYGVLPQRLKSLGHNVKNVFLGKYVTLDNGIALPDLVKAFQAALLDLYGAKLEKRDFGCVTHSTGALVVRRWISSYYKERMEKLPLTHLIMLAPPTHGSRLASVGKSRQGRLRSLLGVEPGLKILEALELGSKFQWDLNSSWMKEKIYAAPGFYPFVITGQWIDKKIWDVIVPATYERGSDGVVRAASANLNMQKITIHPDNQATTEVIEGIPYLVPPKTSHSDTHYGIMGSIPLKGDHPVLKAMEMALRVKDRRSYNTLVSQFAELSAHLQSEEPYHDGSRLDRYCQLIFQVVDNMGNSIEDYAIELLDAEERGDQLPSGFLSDQHKNESNPEFFVYYLNYDRIMDVPGGELGFRVQTITDSPLVNYDQAKFITAVEKLIKPNQTTYIEVVMNRRLNKNMFHLTDDFRKQPIKRTPGPDWIS